MKILPKLEIQSIVDQYIRRNFERLVDYMASASQLLGFEFYDLEFTGAATGVKIAHTIGTTPLDVLVTRATGTGVVSFKYAEFDASFLVLDVSGACRVRFFVGTYYGTPQRNT